MSAIYEEIVSRDNKKVKEFAKLSQSKSHRDSTGFFVIESEKLVNEALQCGVIFEMVFVSSAYIDKNEEFVYSIEKQFQNIPVYIVTDEVEKKLTKAVTPQGIYAVCKKKDQEFDVQQISKGGRYLFLCDVQDAGNMGSIIRTAEAVGMNGVILSKGCCDIYNPKVLRATMGSGFRTHFMKSEDISKTLIELHKNNVTTLASVVDDNEKTIDIVTFKTQEHKSLVLLIGNEGNGLSDEHIKLATERVTIKMQGNAESLNAAMACCILMWEICGRYIDE